MRDKKIHKTNRIAPQRGNLVMSPCMGKKDYSKVGFSFEMFFSVLIISSRIKQCSEYKQPPRKVHKGLLPSLSLCRSCEVGSNGALNWYVPS